MEAPLTILSHRRLEVLRFSPPTRSLDKLFENAPDELDMFHGIPALAKLCDDLVIVYTEGHVILTFWKENRYVVITEVSVTHLI